MNNKAFTLTELLAIIIILGLLATIAAPNIMSAINKSNKKAVERQEKLIEEAAERWAVDNPRDLSAKMTENEAVIKVEELQDKGYLDNDIKNPSKKDKMDGCVLIKKQNNIYKYQYIKQGNHDQCPKIEESEEIIDNGE